MDQHWSRLTEDSDLETALDVVRKSAPHYADTVKTKKVLAKMKHSKGELHYYDNNGLEITLFVLYEEFSTDWRIKYGAFRGGNPHEAGALIWDKIKHTMQGKQGTIYANLAKPEDYPKEMWDFIRYNKDIGVVKETPIKYSNSVGDGFRWEYNYDS